MSLRISNATPSTLADVLVQFRQAFDAMGNGTPVLCGKQYLEHFGAGHGPRVLFVPEPKGGSLDSPTFLGDTATMTHSCDVYIRAAEHGDDFERLKETYLLADLVIDCISQAGTGRLSWGSLDDESPTDVDVFGAGLKFSFTFSRGILHQAARRRLPPSEIDTSDQQGALDPGATTAAGVIVVPFTVPVSP